jgi:unsaturated chondroitin disaccharide hydrolase
MISLAPDRQAKFRSGLDFALDRVRAIAGRLESLPGTPFHFSTHPDGSLEPSPKPLWGDGHWVGLLWLAYEISGDPDFLAWAKHWTAQIEFRKSDTWTHDLGWLLGLSHLKGYYITKDPHYLEVSLTAAENYTKRLNPHIGMIQWHSTRDDSSDNFHTAVDAMMNIAMMWWAWIHTGDRRFYEVGFREASGVIKHMLRPNGSTAHVVNYDPETGAFRHWERGQGYSPDSCWSRGIAWAIYGFAFAYEITGHLPFLEASCRTADFFLKHLPDDQVPYWDFNSPDIPNTYKDSSAAAPVASGLQILARVVGEPALSEKYQAAAHRMIESLTDHYLAKDTPHQGILLHGAQDIPKGHRMDNCLVWGDFFYLEAVSRALGKWSACKYF